MFSVRPPPYHSFLKAVNEIKQKVFAGFASDFAGFISERW
jgi:hypothetical protein